ncbi:MAG: hypothetical protein CMN44_07155 [SAR116 cluster bacterium]|nr:hypothetical protein [SAR116 cluster bacterium]RPH09255.1 MAG: hypothetical protein CBC14_007035 [Alphaproteobacteria bacterium TMED54]
MSKEFKLKLEELENLSIRISDNISLGNYNDILQLDLLRQNIIKSINPEHAINFKNDLTKIYEKNLNHVNAINENLSNLKKESRHSLECFAAYKKK